MASAPVFLPVPSPDEVRRIVALEDLTLRNLFVTTSYYRLSQAFGARTGIACNWCTFAVWASKQAGRTIRGEDLIQAFTANTLSGSVFAHPIRNFWSLLLRRGLRSEVEARTYSRCHTRAARRRCARTRGSGGRQSSGVWGDWTRLRSVPRVFRRKFPKQRTRIAGSVRNVRRCGGRSRSVGSSPTDPPRKSADRPARATAAPATYSGCNGSWARRSRSDWIPRAPGDTPAIRKLEALLEEGDSLGDRTVARSFQRHVRKTLRLFITQQLMSLALPDTTIALGQDIDRVSPADLATITNATLKSLLDEFQKGDGLRDWADLNYRMHLIAGLFRAFQQSQTLLQAPFTPEQSSTISAGRVPTGAL